MQSKELKWLLQILLIQTCNIPELQFDDGVLVECEYFEGKVNTDGALVVRTEHVVCVALDK